VNDNDTETLITDDLWSFLKYFVDAHCDLYRIVQLYFFAVVFPILKLLIEGSSLYMKCCLESDAPFPQGDCCLCLNNRRGLKNIILGASHFEVRMVAPVVYKLSEVIVYIGLFVLLIGTLSFKTEDGSLRIDLTVPVKDGSFFFVVAHLASLAVADMLLYIQLNYSDDDYNDEMDADGDDNNVRASVTATNDYQAISPAPSDTGGDEEHAPSAQQDTARTSMSKASNNVTDTSASEEDKKVVVDTTSAAGTSTSTSNDLTVPLVESTADETHETSPSRDGDNNDSENVQSSTSERTRWLMLKALCQNLVSRSVFLNLLLFVIVVSGVAVLFAPIIRLEYYGFNTVLLDDKYISNEYTVYGLIDAIYDILREEEGTLSAFLFFLFFLVDVILSTAIVLIMAAFLEHPKILAHIPDESRVYSILLYTYPFMNIESFTVAFMLFAATAEDLGEWVLNDMIDVCDKIDNNTHTECLKLKSTVLEGAGALFIFFLSSVLYIRLVIIKTKARITNSVDDDAADGIAQ